jgi:hypothetical protein
MAKQIDFIEHQSFLISLTKRQIASIEPKSTDGGSMQFTLPTNLKNQSGPNRARRDLYTAVLIGNWAAKCYRDFNNLPKEFEGNWEPTLF